MIFFAVGSCGFVVAKSRNLQRGGCQILSPFPYKMGPYNEWGPYESISRAITSVTHLFLAIHIGALFPYL